jgi:hypothetical protein
MLVTANGVSEEEFSIKRSEESQNPILRYGAFPLQAGKKWNLLLHVYANLATRKSRAKDRAVTEG